MASFVARLLSFVVQVVLAYPGYCLLAKRFHDRGKPELTRQSPSASVLAALLGLFGIAGGPGGPNLFGTLVGLINLAVVIWVVVDLGILRGTEGENRYGPDPLGAV